ncbi:M23 family metallopeptidase [Luteimonas sp. 50]|uniref:M23 family metallopeptidase n=1 Tax=Cognatiluteimonas sedimenti TaxID=2927791 RepID=A0ABT0A439_9GAMM|nr:M23 family metallopeptidase [Lysobacter sedimenti]MCJ0825752.1 M23 family metallopeptidase [Lysobacter sedimenti]
MPAPPPPARLWPALLAALVATAGVAHAGKVYKWTDRNGVVHYGDRPPDANAAVKHVKVIPVQAQPGAMVRLRVENSDGAYMAWADNTLAGPIEVMLRFSRERNVAGDPSLPARATVPARGSALVARIGAVDPAQPGEFELRLDGIPGDPSARPSDVQYLLPLRQGALQVDQGYGGSFSHTDPQNLYAVDFAADVGTSVLAARAGVVMQVENDFDKAGLNREKYGGRANFVRILHDDGTMALYAHLKPEGVMVRVGQRVQAGQQIGLSGNTGFTTGPHLHFAVQVNRGMRLESIPFRMLGPRGELRFGDRR